LFFPPPRAGQDLGITLCDMDAMDIWRQMPVGVCRRLVMAGRDNEV
jgi:hypothetical protein